MNSNKDLAGPPMSATGGGGPGETLKRKKYLKRKVVHGILEYKWISGRWWRVGLLSASLVIL